jgi:F0F1-type ATP synthase membrane subunit b/b'
MNIFLPISLLLNIVVMAFLLAFMYSLYMKDKQYDRERRRMHVDSSKSIEDAHRRSKEIIEQAVEKARDTLIHTEYIREDLIKNLETDLNDVSEATVKLLRSEALSFSKEYKEMLENIQLEHAKLLEEARIALKDVEYSRQTLQADMQTQVKDILTKSQKSLEAESSVFNDEYKQAMEAAKNEYMAKAGEVLKQLETIPETELESFKQTLQAEAATARETLQKQITGLFASAEKEVDTYKQQRMHEVEQSVAQVTTEILEEALGKKLTKADQETLVINGLEKAKIDGVLYANNEAQNQVK